MSMTGEQWRFYKAAALVRAALDPGRPVPQATAVIVHGKDAPMPPTPRELRRRRMAAVSYEPPKVYADKRGLYPSSARADARRRRQIQRGQLKPNQE